MVTYFNDSFVKHRVWHCVNYYYYYYYYFHYYSMCPGVQSAQWWFPRTSVEYTIKAADLCPQLHSSASMHLISSLPVIAGYFPFTWS